MRQQSDDNRSAATLADRKNAYQAFLGALDWNYNRAQLLRTHVDLVGWRDPIDKMLGTKPPRDIFDFDAATAPAHTSLLLAGAAVRLHGSPEGIGAANDAATALATVSQLATTGAARLEWLHGIVWRNIKRRLRLPDPVVAKRLVADDAYFLCRRAFENLVRAECGISTIDNETPYLPTTAQAPARAV